jgi:hypothetical protein
VHYITLASMTNGNHRISYPLSMIELSYDHAGKRLEIRLLEGLLPKWP